MNGPFTDFTDIVTSANLVAGLVLMFRLALARLASRYPLFFIYMIVDTLGAVSGIFVPRHTNLYAQAYMALQAAGIAAAVGVLFEMCRLTLAGHPALAAVSRALAGTVVLCSAVLAVMVVLLGDDPGPGRSVVLYRFFIVERILDLSLAALLIALTMFLTWFPVRVRRNIWIYAAGFSVYFFARSFVLLMVNRLPVQHVDALSDLTQCISLTCLIVWIWRLRPEGEEILTVTGHRWNPDAFERLSRQLKSINGAAVRITRR